jgi:hypothetical protein
VRGWLVGVIGADTATVTTTWTPDNKPAVWSRCRCSAPMRR